jgi:lipid-binding SYLF domain-containing protein
MQQQPTEATQECTPAPVQRQQNPPAGCIISRDLPLVYEKEAERAADAAKVLADFPRQSSLDDAKAIAVIPALRKGAFFFGGRWGRGLMTRRGRDGCWNPPSFIQLTGGNFGIQFGVQSTDLVLVFTSDAAVDSILRGKFTLNADASAAAGPFGRKAQAGVPALLGGGILSFISRSKGAFVGFSLDGAAITIDDTANRRVYGKNISGTDILVNRRVETNDVVAGFLNSLDKHSPGPRRASAQQTPVDESAAVQK